LCAFLISPMRDTCFVCLVLLGLITLTGIRF
jgi:hypothetical protein